MTRLAALVLVAATAHAEQSRQERLSFDNSAKNDGAQAMTYRCGFFTPITYDDRLFTVGMKNNNGGFTYCLRSRWAFAYLCEQDGYYKALLKERVKQIDCTASDSPEDFAMSLKPDGTLAISVGEKANENAIKSKVVNFLKGTLEVKDDAGATVPVGAYLGRKAELARFNDPKDDSSASMAARCGASVPLTFDYELVAVANRDNTGGMMYCLGVRRALKTFCERSAAAKEWVQQKIKDVSCSHSSDPKELQVSLSGATLVLKYGEKIKSRATEDQVLAFLERTVKP